MADYRGLFYNTAPLGLGHLLRSINLAKGLLKLFDIDFFLGSLPLAAMPDSPHFRLFQLPPLMQTLSKNDLIDAAGTRPFNEMLALRKEYIEAHAAEKYDFFISEHFPFGRSILSEEILYLIDRLKKNNPSCLIASSFRGEKNIPEKRKAEIEKLLKDQFDCIFVHTDPLIDPAASLLQQFSGLKEKFIFTGYVGNPEFFEEGMPRKNQIVVSRGSGIYGEELIRACLLAAQMLPECPFLILLGPKTQDNFRQEVDSIKHSLKLYNLSIVDSLANFPKILQESSLSISYGGAGTLADILLTRTPAIIFPQEKQPDQQIRASLLAEKGLIKVIQRDDLEPFRLTSLIQEALQKPFPEIPINLDGAKITAETIQLMLTRN